jgi:hypothetical protein
MRILTIIHIFNSINLLKKYLEMATMNYIFLLVAMEIFLAMLKGSFGWTLFQARNGFINKKMIFQIYIWGKNVSPKYITLLSISLSDN